RRVLLNSLQGTAVTAVRIHGVQHEFSSIPDIAEDVTEIILNLKELRLKALTSANQFTITIEKESEGVLRASDISTGGMVEVLNPEHKIC
ncbi:DNA-directed RNA polymerase subunit alpha, partial [Pseudomonas sp. FW300-N1A5]